ncbi:NAD(P)/FAD-dependent oxidoreductase [Sporosarcina gallistercoris]|uniref:FAD-binding oxidoreductase n=1 Tax=Sporosarcina gallistercoris TaxID=2762245 RepID=A0ABR8PFT8_9BACL|nr:FAD-dependent oxidoreductase [Sporosarcina gallistercoris]MBD7907034.1 FAD-binding oxidoreductase [Sporosarcina gallistercoris]
MEQIIIIGSGILGSSTAYELAKRGASVTVIDRNDQGSATRAAAGIICPWLSQRRNQDWYKLVRNGAKHYKTLIPELEALGETETGYRQVGAISLFAEDSKLQKAYERALTRREQAPEIGDIVKLTQAQTKQYYPPIAEGFQSIYISGAARVDGRQLQQALIRSAKHFGAVFLEGSAELHKDTNGSIQVVCNGQIHDADKIILTTGAWPPVFGPLSIRLNVRGQKAQIVHMDPLDENSSNWPVVIPPGDQYLLSLDDGRVIAGATHEDEHVFEPTVTVGGVQEVLSKALNVAPGLEHAELVEVRTGVRPFTPGFLPIIGQLPEHSSVLIANGLGASGLTAGPYLGRLLAQLTLGEEMELDLSPYSVEQAIEHL